MVAIDTNVLVRLLTGDDAAQFQSSQALFASEQVFIPETVLLESEWVLRAAFGLSPADITDAFKRILGLPNVVVANRQRLAQVIDWHQHGLDFADAMHLAFAQGQKKLKTFDAVFVKRANGLSECQVERLQ
jgi:predicted nucleic-acid-binding protein